VSFAAITLCVLLNECLLLCVFRYRLSPETFGYSLSTIPNVLYFQVIPYIGVDKFE
jgi:hypothetical protein